MKEFINKSKAKYVYVSVHARTSEPYYEYCLMKIIKLCNRVEKSWCAEQLVHYINWIDDSYIFGFSRLVSVHDIHRALLPIKLMYF